MASPKKNKVLIFQSFCRLPKRFYPSFKKQFLSLFDYNGRLLSQSEDLKVYFFQKLKESQHQDAFTALIDILAESKAPWHSLSDLAKKHLITHVVQLSPLAWQRYAFRDFLQEFEEHGLLCQEERILTTDLMSYYGDLTNAIQSFIYTKAQSLNKHEQRILITILLLHSERFAKFTTAQRQRVIETSCRDLVPLLSRLTQKFQETPNKTDPNRTCVLYDELFDYFEPISIRADDLSSDMEELD